MSENTEPGGNSAVLALLASHHVMSLATTIAGEVHATSLMYANDGLTIFWVSAPDSRHSCELTGNPRVAATIARDYTDFAEIEGLQIKGTAHPVDNLKDRLKAIQLLSKRYAFLKSFLGDSGALVKHMSKATVYRLDPTEITLIDNKKGFGHKEQFVIMD